MTRTPVAICAQHAEHLLLCLTKKMKTFGYAYALKFISKSVRGKARKDAKFFN